MTHETNGQEERRLYQEMEAELAHLRRVESLGYLTASVIHDFNNLLTPMVCLSAMLTRELEKGTLASEMAVELLETAERAAGLARQMLSSVRRRPDEAKRVNVGGVVSEIRGLLRRVVGNEVELSVAIDEDAGDVVANREQLEQVILNLAANARDAMPRGGRLFVSTTPITVPRGDENEPAHAGPYVALRVSDTGTGMPPEVRERVFERFFTTKPGDGHGLGLAAAHRFAKANKGYIDVKSAEGVGTTVTLCLPRADGEESVAPPASHEHLPRGSEVVLVAEDDASVRGCVRALLETHGYRVLDAASGKEAVEIAGLHLGSIDLLLTDLVMPDMSGLGLASALASMGMSMRVLFMSGHTDAAIRAQGLDPDASILLRKAFSPADLLLKVRAVLGEESPRLALSSA
jgi:nitrogen-specific signal transduction histidine kinase/ActR/RegA family two-component response regulator